jgi:hypothetical protein
VQPCKIDLNLELLAQDPLSVSIRIAEQLSTLGQTIQSSASNCPTQHWRLLNFQT